MPELTKLQAVGQHKLITSNPDFRAPFIYLLDLDITKFLLIYSDLWIKTSDIIYHHWSENHPTAKGPHNFFGTWSN